MKLVIFDVDGTLIDSQAEILAAMAAAFSGEGLDPPRREEVLGIVGLSLPEAMAALRPDLTPTRLAALAGAYRASFRERREAGEAAPAPFYPGAEAALSRLSARGHLLAIATGKARRGLDHMLSAHGLAHLFVTTQTADDAPSKPAPHMVLNCAAVAGVAPSDAVVVGDTAYDMEMARAAGARALGVAWGYHSRERLLAGGAEAILDGFPALDPALAALGAGP